MQACLLTAVTTISMLGNQATAAAAGPTAASATLDPTEFNHTSSSAVVDPRLAPVANNGVAPQRTKRKRKPRGGTAAAAAAAATAAQVGVVGDNIEMDDADGGPGCATKRGRHIHRPARLAAFAVNDEVGSLLNLSFMLLNCAVSMCMKCSKFVLW